MANAGTALTFVFALAGLCAASCGTNAKGVSDCRSIERARCRAATACGVVGDVEECERFYRDQCLHGLAVPSPGKPAISECVAAIESAGECAKSGEEGSACSGSMTPTSACEQILHPERFTACNFLSPTETPIDEAGGAGNSGGSANQASGGKTEETSGGNPATGGQSDGDEPSPSGGSADTPAQGGTGGVP